VASGIASVLAAISLLNSVPIFLHESFNTCACAGLLFYIDCISALACAISAVKLASVAAVGEATSANIPL